MDHENPYAAPSTFSPIQTAPSERPVAQRLASQGARFANMLIDMIVCYALSFATGVVLGVIFAITRSNPTSPAASQEIELLSMLLSLFVNTTYFVLMEFLFQRTLGKLVTGTMVVSERGGRPSFGQILGRSLARFIPFEPFSFFGGNGRPVGWHDSLSGTRVISVR